MDLIWFRWFGSDDFLFDRKEVGGLFRDCLDDSNVWSAWIEEDDLGYLSIFHAGAVVVATGWLKAECDAVGVHGFMKHFAQAFGPVIAIRSFERWWSYVFLVRLYLDRFFKEHSYRIVGAVANERVGCLGTSCTWFEMYELLRLVRKEIRDRWTMMEEEVEMGLTWILQL